MLQVLKDKGIHYGDKFEDCYFAWNMSRASSVEPQRRLSTFPFENGSAARSSHEQRPDAKCVSHAINIGRSRSSLKHKIS